MNVVPFDVRTDALSMECGTRNRWHGAGGGEDVGGSVDRYTVLITAFLLLVGFLVLYSASSPFSMKHFGGDTFMLTRQLIAGAVGLIALLVLQSLDYHVLARWNDVLLILGILLTLATLVPSPITGDRWISIGPFNFQPTEALKFSFILFLAGSLARKGARVRTFREGVLPYLILLGLVAAIVINQPDLGMIMVLGAVTIAMLFFAGARVLHLGTIAVASAPLVFLAIRLAPYRFARLLSFFNPDAYSTTTGYQTIQSLTAVGTGGVLGRGLGASHAKLFYLPQSHNDFIMSIAAEELGLVGVLAIVGLLSLLIWRAFVISEAAADPTGQLIALGIGFTLAFQMLVNLGVVVGLLPVTGLTFPFLSNGGSSLIITLAMVGTLLNVSKGVVKS